MNPPDAHKNSGKTSLENEWAGYTRELSQLIGNQLIFLNSIPTQAESHGFHKGGDPGRLCSVLEVCRIWMPTFCSRFGELCWEKISRRR